MTPPYGHDPFEPRWGSPHFRNGLGFLSSGENLPLPAFLPLRNDSLRRCSTISQIFFWTVLSAEPRRSWSLVTSASSSYEAAKASVISSFTDARNDLLSDTDTSG